MPVPVTRVAVHFPDSDIAVAVPPQDIATALGVVVADLAAQNPEIRSLPAV
jgi:hypothetical protein